MKKLEDYICTKKACQMILRGVAYSYKYLKTISPTDHGLPRPSDDNSHWRRTFQYCWLVWKY
ncbi:hypothetical protein NECAME_05552 [Necator americanus]|uniref:Uncharacterized protein n=1 Tax=Necator americanus TaxID=51031 RepID=W2SGB3_NECAM|nr:hypothetical protein NECAME_05552 [Necator americanus]ETN68588.1 hypothetical protein NECAME_05552 [Necator americanus]